MAEQSKHPNDLPEIPPLDSMTANQVLNNVLVACDRPLSKIPVETLEEWGNYKSYDFKICRRIACVILAVLIFLPLMFFHPTIIAERTNVNPSDAATFEVSVQNLLPVDGVSATLDGTPLNTERVDSKHYYVTVPENGTLKIKAVSLNGQITENTYEVTHIDTDKPQLSDYYVEDNYVCLIVHDTYSGVDYSSISASTSSGDVVAPVFVDAESGTIVFDIPSQPVTVSVSDMSGNTLEILLSPTE